MALYAILTAPPSVQKLVSKVTSDLGTVSYLEGITRVPTSENGFLLFRFTWVNDFNDLTNEVIETMTPDVQHTIATLAGAKIRKARPPAIGFLVKGMLWTPRNEAAILYPLPIPIDTFKNALKVLASRQISDDLKELLQFLQIPDTARNEATLQLYKFPDARNGCEVRLLPQEVALALEDAQFEMVPLWIPFLIIPMSTFKEHGD
ncbi:hypothetical protein GQ44DRAFT_718014 [Phaeosphaeriaceae sp. PMI808]|nr:hypothetical protein GQ44DRAFT_718014 [Phaeosphaeriaceae sp. PMI808]